MATLVASALLVACVGPARTFGVYESKAENSVEQSLSGVQTVRAAIDDAIAGDAYASSISITIQNATDAIDGAESNFASIQPPDQASDSLRDRVLPVLSDAGDLAAKARIAARRTDAPTLADLRRPLEDVSSRLSALLNDLV
jgi:hypothetical protein